MVVVEHLTDIFSGEIDRSVIEAGVPLSSVVPRGFAGEIRVNGRRIHPARWHSFRLPRDSRVFVAQIPGEGVSIGTILLSVLIGSVVSVGLSFAASALFPPEEPRFDPDRPDDVARPRFSGTQTTVGAGQTIPIILGRTRIGGHIIESFTDVKFDDWPSDPGVTLVAESAESADTARRLNTRLVLGWGPIQSISDLRIDGNPVNLIRGVAY